MQPLVSRAIIPAGGLGTRLAPLTHLMPKEMLPVGNRVVLQHVIEECDSAGLTQLLVVINRNKTQLFPVGQETPTESDPITGVPRRAVYFANQEVQGGLAHSILHGEQFAGDHHFAVLLGDTIIQSDPDQEQRLIQRLIATHTQSGAAVTVAVQWIPDPSISRYGVIDPEGDPSSRPIRVRRVVEKPAHGDAPSRWAITARYVFGPRIFEACRRSPRAPSGEIELTAAITWLAAEGEQVVAVPLEGSEQRLDIGSPATYAAACRQFSG